MRKLLHLLFLLALVISSNAQTAADTWGTTPALHVEGNHLVDETGKQVMLHGIMDTPSPYFCGYRFTDGHWIDVYNQGDSYITKCINYFNNIFTATTKAGEKGSWCNVFRLHLDPCWTDNPNVNASGFTVKDGKTYDPNGNEVSGEADIQHFDKNRLTSYLDRLYLPIAKKAQGHGMYVILRPPGVCPNTIKVGDYYQKYLLTVWDLVTQNSTVLENSGWLSIELANEPINIRDKNGNTSATAKRDFFQPIVDKIRANGFKGIIWIPGETWQQEYKSYATYPVKDVKIEGYEDEQFGYAVHWYPGWYGTSDDSYVGKNSLSSFLGMVPVAKKKPIMITEVDWSPENPNEPGKYNEWGQWVHGNYGTWGTGSTSKFGMAYKYVIDYLDNCGMTLTHTHDYLDIDYYLNTGVARPAFTSKMPNKDPWEACSGACWQWYKEYAHKVHEAHDWNAVVKYYFDEAKEVNLASGSLDGKVLAATNETCSDFWYVNSSENSPQDVKKANIEDWGNQSYNYLKFTKVTNSGCKTTGDIYEIQFCNDAGVAYSLWGDNGYFNAQPNNGSVLFALGLKSQYGQDGKYFGLWKIGHEDGKGYTFQNVGRIEASQSAYVYPSATSPQSEKVYVRLFTEVSEKKPTGIEQVRANGEKATAVGIFDLTGRRVPALQKGVNIIRYNDGTSKKVYVK